MGAGGSVVSLENLTAEGVGDAVSHLGTAYEKYKEALVSNGISGAFIASQTMEEMQCLFADLGITMILHQKVLLSHFNLLKNGGVGGGGGGAPGITNGSNKVHASVPAAGNDSECCQYHPLPVDFQINDHVTGSPRAIMAKLFEIQGIAVDPTELDTAVEKIAKAVGVGFGDGSQKYDCFINYRVSSDADLAEKLYLYLKTKNIHAFLDKKCLRNGEKWKEGFLNGLKNSKCFLAIISRKGLELIRDENTDHTWDNVLLEYETALAIKDATSNSKYICPLHVGACEKGVLTKFIDFAGSMYPDTLNPKGQEEARIAEPTQAAAAPAVEEAVEKAPEIPPPAPVIVKNIDVCGKCSEKISRKPMGTWGNGWTCDWPGHEGANRFLRTDPLYGCPTIKGCNWGVCQACWDNIQATQRAQMQAENEDADWDICDQPQGTRSKFNDSYYCDVQRVACKVSDDKSTFYTCVSYSVRGDTSLGALQEPSTSHLVINGRNVAPSEVKIYIRDPFQIQGDLIFVTPIGQLTEFITKPVGFVFGSYGYSTAKLVVPNSQEVQECRFPTCRNGHLMPISDYTGGGYSTGYVCDKCRVGKRGLRWFCQPCTSDFCFSCDPVQPMQPVCLKQHTLERRTTNPKEYRGHARCDKCKRTNLPNDPEFYHCKDGCKYDLCLKCASRQIAGLG